ncbi:hypothetical protein X767_32700 [Mesorhizobium sp. LSJC264A00]|nr:hypothetical protein X767_32700 [Mesorhizobium sp. LSJC264A00]
MHLEKLASYPLLHTPHADLSAKIWMPAIMNFQFVPDMGTMNG